MKAPPISLSLLRATLILRCIVSLIFAGYLVVARPSTLPDILSAFGKFSITDGALSLFLAIVILVAGWYRGLAALAALAGLVRIAAALGVRMAPGMPGFPVTLMLYIGILATLVFLLGLLRLSAARRLHGQLGGNPWTVVLIVQGVAVAVIAVMAFVATVSPTGMRELLALAEAINAFALLAVALRVGQPGLRPSVVHAA